MYFKYSFVFLFLLIFVQVQSSGQDFALRDFDVMSCPGVMAAKDNKKGYTWSLKPLFENASIKFYEQVRHGAVGMQVGDNLYGYQVKLVKNKDTGRYSPASVDRCDVDVMQYYVNHVDQVREAMVQKCQEIDDQGWGGKDWSDVDRK